MANPSRISTLTLSGAGGSRTWTATAAVQDTAAGAAVSITLASSSTGATPPVVETAYTLRIRVDNTTTLVRSYFLSPNPNNVQTFNFTVDGVSGSAIRAGLLRMVIEVQQAAGLAATQYNGSSDGTDVPPTGFTFTVANSGYIRGTTTAVTTLTPETGAYGDTLTATTVLGAAPYKSYTVRTQVGALAFAASAASTTNTFVTAQGLVDNRFAAASTTQGTVTTIPNAALVATPWTVAPATEDSSVIDPRLTFLHLLQVNDNVFGVPPSVKDVGSQRLTSDLGFLSSRVMNAAGVGVNGITYLATLADAGALVAPLTRSTTTAAAGGQDGWGPTFLVWADALPTGTWNKSVVITAPATATGLEASNTKNYSLVAANPNYRMLVGAGPATTETDARHFTPGTPLLVGMEVFNTSTNATMTLDTSPAPAIALGRFNLTFGRGEFLDSDMVWKAATGATVYYWPCTVSPGDPNAWTVVFADTSGFSVSDLFIVGKAMIGGVPVSSFQKEVCVAGVNNHSGYTFDGAGFVGFPTR